MHKQTKRKISMILVLALVLVQFTGIVPAQAAAGPVEQRITFDSAAQVTPVVYGDKIVWVDNRNGDLNWDIYMYSLTTGTETRITTNPNNQTDPDIYGDKIVWVDDRNGNDDIYMYNLTTGIETQITSDTSDQQNPVVYGDKIVWVDARNGANNDDIYMYNLTTGAETQITTDPNDQGDPDIYGNIIVWDDHRNSGVYSYNWDIYMYNLDTGVETRVTTDTREQYFPSVYQDKIVWQDNYNSNWEIFMYNITTGTQTRITTNAESQRYPKIYGDNIVWYDDRNSVGMLTNEDVYMYSISTGTETRLTFDPDRQYYPAIFGDKVVWHDTRNGNYDIYMIDMAKPYVTAASPDENAVNVPVNQEISVTFSENVQRSVYYTDISIMTGETMVTYTASLSGSTLTLTPDTNLAPNSYYTVTVPAGAVKDVENNAVPDYSFSFTTGNIMGLSFQAADVIQDPVDPVLYMTDKTNKKLYKINYETGETEVMDFVYMPESLEIGQGAYAGELYVALLHQEHSSYWDEANQSGTIAVIDRVYFTQQDTFDISVDPYDLVAGRDGHIYVPSGSGQWTNLDSYNRSTKQLIHRTGIRQESYALLHPSLDRIYTIDTDTSPRDFTAFNINNGNFTDPVYPGGYDSPYHGDYSLTTKFSLDPTGNYIFNGSGNVFTTASAQAQDMLYFGSLGTGFTNIAYESDGSKIYTLPPNTDYVYTYTYSGSGFTKSANNIRLPGNGKYLFERGNQLIAVTQPNTGDSFLTGIHVLDLPMVLSTTPAANYPDIQISDNINVNFNTDIVAGAAYSSITLKDSSNSGIPFTVDFNGSALIIDPENNLDYGTAYTVTIPAGAVEDTMGNPLQSDYLFSFATAALDTVAPMLTATLPTGNAVNVPVTQAITLNFSEPVQAGVDYNSITIEAGTTVVSYTYNLSGSTLTLTPAGNLAYSTTYDVTIPWGAITDLAGNAMDMDNVLSFTTQAAASSSPSSDTSSDTSPSSNASGSTSPGVVVISNPGEISSSTDAGQTITTVAVNEATTLNTINKSITGTTVVIPVNQSTDVVNTKIPFGLMVALANKSSSLEIQTSAGSYTISANQIKTADIVKELKAEGTSVTFSIVIAKAKPEQTASIQKFAEQHNLTQMVTPIEFKVEAVNGDNKLEINNFSEYVSRSIVIPNAVNSEITVGAVQNADGTLSPVPTQFKQENGKTVAIIKRKTNSIYTVVQHQKKFNDVAQHWAKDDINLLASKLIITGRTDDTFAPDENLTRAEFAVLIARALGLHPVAAKAKFNDVRAGDWYTGALGAAVEAGIIKGYNDSTFRPNAKVSREEVAAMVVQSLKVAGIDTSINTSETDRFINQFMDNRKIDSWAKTAVAVAVKNGIIKGDNKGNFAPIDNSSRAETAVMIKNLLTKASFI